MELWGQVKHIKTIKFLTDITRRPGDAIVTVDGWLITLMDQPKVGRQGKGSRGKCRGKTQIPVQNLFLPGGLQPLPGRL